MSSPLSRNPKPGAGSPPQGGRLGRVLAGLGDLVRLLAAHVQGLLAPADAFSAPDLSRVERLVFVCQANLYRSAFAQAVCEQAGLPAASFGLYTRTGVRSPSAVRVAASLGVRLDDHRATHLRDFQAAPGDFYLVTDPRQAQHLVRRGFPAERIALLGRWCRPRRLSIPDPHRKGDEALRRCFELVRAATLNLVQELRRVQLCAGGSSRPVPRHEADAADDFDTVPQT